MRCPFVEPDWQRPKTIGSKATYPPGNSQFYFASIKQVLFGYFNRQAGN